MLKNSEFLVLRGKRPFAGLAVKEIAVRALQLPSFVIVIVKYI
jgi:hypothetical protein